MKAIFYALALLAVAGAAYFSYDNLEKFKAQQQEKVQAIEANKLMSRNVDTKQEELTAELAALDTAQKERAEANASIENLVAKEKTLRRDLGELENTLEAQKEEFAELEKSRLEVEAILAEVGEEAGQEVSLDNLPDLVEQIEADRQAKVKQLGELEELVSAAENTVTSNQGEIGRLADVDATRDVRISRNAMESVVSAVNNEWGFVIIGAGSNTGFTPQTRLLVKRGGRLIAELQPSSIEPSQTIAEIDEDTLAPGARIQPGDRVILANPATN